MKLDRAQVYIGLGIVAMAGLYYLGRKAMQGFGTVATAISPTNHDNIFATTVNDIGGILVTEPEGPGKNADGSWSLGGWLYDVTHPAQARDVANLSSGAVQRRNVSDPPTFTPSGTSAGVYIFDPTGKFDPSGRAHRS